MTAGRDVGEDLLRILNGLNGLISNTRSVPMSTSAIVNRENALHLIDQARDAVPSAVRHAEKIVTDADAVLAKGQAESEWPVQYAQEGSERLVAGENIVRVVNDRADSIMATAGDKTASLRHGTDEYSDRTLASLEAEVAKTAEQIRVSREVLTGRPGSGTGQPVGIQGPVHCRLGWSVDPSAH